MKAISDALRVFPLALSPASVHELLHAVLGVSHAQAPDQLLSVNLAGFLYVSDVDPVRQTVTYLAPCLGPVPGKYLLLGSLKVMMQ